MVSAATTASTRARVTPTVIAASLALLLLPSELGASPPDTIGMGARSIALGGAVGAIVSDASANYYNPAGIVREGNIRVSVGYQRLQSRLFVNGVNSHVEGIGAMGLGVIVPGEIKGVRFGLGLGVLLNDQRLSRTRSPILNRPRWELYDTRPHKIYLAVNFAIRPVDWLYIGGGMTFQAPSNLTMGMRGSLDVLAPGYTKLEHSIQGDLTSIKYPQFGVQFTPHERLSFGVTYRGSYRIDGILTVVANANLTAVGMPVADLSLRLASYSMSTYGPQQVVLSTAADATSRLRLSFDLTWLDWSKHPSLVPLEEVSLVVDDGGALGLSLPSDISGRKPIPMHLHDRFVPRLGAEYMALDRDAYEVRVRGGFVYERSPYPLQHGQTNFLDCDRYSFSLGAGFALTDLAPILRGRLQIDAYVLYAYLPNRTHIKDSLVDPVGDLVAGGHQFGAGVQLEVVFE